MSAVSVDSVPSVAAVVAATTAAQAAGAMGGGGISGERLRVLQWLIVGMAPCRDRFPAAGMAGIAGHSPPGQVGITIGGET